jgi:hypothetical protein
MKLKKIFAVEITLVLIVLIVIMVFIETAPYLASSRDNDSIGVFDQKSYPKRTLSLASGKSANATFNYSSYDPSIIVLDLSFETCEKPGYFLLYCNYREIVNIFINSETPPLTLNLISVSGLDWVEPPSAMFGLNELLFESPSQDGYAGTLAYQISLRGSR